MSPESDREQARNLMSSDGASDPKTLRALEWHRHAMYWLKLAEYAQIIVFLIIVVALAGLIFQLEWAYFPIMLLGGIYIGLTARRL